MDTLVDTKKKTGKFSLNEFYLGSGQKKVTTQLKKTPKKK